MELPGRRPRGSLKRRYVAREDMKERRRQWIGFDGDRLYAVATPEREKPK